jgi:hypothetical protein
MVYNELVLVLKLYVQMKKSAESLSLNNWDSMMYCEDEQVLARDFSLGITYPAINYGGELVASQ